MSQINPYAPPSAKVADISHGEAAPALWNPNAAASWSLLFSPIFGAYLHMRNWEALGETEKAATSRKWMLGAIAFFVAAVLIGLVLPDTKAVDGLSRAASIAMLVTWYYSIGKSQQAFVTARFGKNYPRRGWLKPLSAAVGIFMAFVAVVILISLVFGGSA